jgi:hypothetical protein
MLKPRGCEAAADDPPQQPLFYRRGSFSDKASVRVIDGRMTTARVLSRSDIIRFENAFYLWANFDATPNHPIDPRGLGRVNRQRGRCSLV